MTQQSESQAFEKWASCLDDSWRAAEYYLKARLLSDEMVELATTAAYMKHSEQCKEDLCSIEIISWDNMANNLLKDEWRDKMRAALQAIVEEL